MTRRITDRDGHRWPVTGRRCTTCGMPTLLDDVHPTCQPAARRGHTPVPGVVDQVVKALNAEPVGYHTTRWLVSGAPLPSAPTTTSTPRRRTP